MRRFALALIVTALPLFAAVPLPNAPTKYVTDAANVIPDDRELALNERLAQFERETTNQVIVYVDRKVPAGTTIEEMGAEAIKMWAVGQAKKDNGAILFLFIDDRESRIEVGYGLEGTLTDARSKRILVGMRDALRAGDYAGAVEAGAGAIVETIRNPQPEPQPQPRRRGVRAPPISTGLPLAEILGLVFFLAMGAFIVVILIVTLVKNRTPGSSSSWPSSPTDWPSNSSSDSSFSSFSSSSSDSSSSSSSSSSSFSGGGGSGGGGGASDKW